MLWIRLGMMATTVLLLYLLNLIVQVQCFAADEIVSMPGLKEKLPFKQYSGYLNGNDGSRLFYWFVESQSSPAEDPLMLWLNGGPGCSSLAGLIDENGPIFIRDDLTVARRPFNHTWNAFANILYLETPAGVGFSYAQDDKMKINDDTTAENNYAAIKHFFLKFPQYSNRPFFIAGESYAGVYIPTLARRVVQDSSINLIGLAIGNGLLDNNINYQSLIRYANYHGILGPTLWANLKQHCCQGEICRFIGDISSKCQNTIQIAMKTIYTDGLNLYNFYTQCSQYPMSQIRQYTAFTTLTKSTHGLFGSPPCFNNSVAVKYFRRDDVKKALHVSDQAQPWTVCSSGLSYRTQYKSAVKLIPSLSQKCRILLYFGDLDMVCNFLGGEESISSTGLPTIGNYQPWHYTDNNGRQVGGFATLYPNVKFVTVKGAGHLVPGDRPTEAWWMMKDFIQHPFHNPSFFNGNIPALVAVIVLGVAAIIMELF